MSCNGAGACGCGCSGAMGALGAVAFDPLAAKVSGIGAPGDILPTIVWPSDVEAQKRRIDPMMRTTDAAVLGCAAMSASEVAGWSKFYAAWRKFFDEPVGLFGSANKYDEALSYERQLAGWQEQIRPKCNVPGPAPELPKATAETTADAIKWVAIAAVAIAGVYALSPVIMGARKLAT